MSDSREALPPCYRPVDGAPWKVWIQAGKVWPRGDQPYRDTPDGMMVDREILGGLTGKLLRSDGSWLGVVGAQLHSQNGRWHSPLYTLLVPSHLMRLDRPWRRPDDTGLQH